MTRRRTSSGSEKRERNAVPENSINRSDLMAAMPAVYELAGLSDFKPPNFTIKGETVGHVLPAALLADYLEQHTETAHDTKISLMGVRESYAHFKDKNHILTQGNSAAILLLGGHKEENRLLALVSPPLYKKIRDAAHAKPKETIATQNSVPEQASENTVPPVPAIVFFRDTAEIARLCHERKPVIIHQIGAEGLAAVPIDIGAELKERFFSKKGTDFIQPVTAVDFGTVKMDYQSVLAGQRFMNFVREKSFKGWKSNTPHFTVIPTRLLAFLDMDNEGVIQGVKNADPLQFSFSSAAQMTAWGKKTITKIIPPDTPGATSLWIELLEKFESSSSPTRNDEPANKKSFRSLDKAQATVSGNVDSAGKLSDLSVEFSRNSIHDTLQRLAAINVIHIGRGEFDVPSLSR
ncbi:MAG: hypothetical protein WBK77_00890 [Alphaproteobacteria bacterium]